MLKRTTIMALILAAVVPAGCRTTTPPDWVTKESWAYPADRGKAVYAVGIGSDLDPRLRLDMARANARAELARRMQVHVQELVKDCMSRRGDHFNEQYAESVQLYSQLGKQVTNVLLSGSHVFDKWIDEKGLRGRKDALYVLMIIVRDDTFFDAVEEESGRVVRQHKAKLLKTDVDSALKELQEEFATARAAEVPRVKTD